MRANSLPKSARKKAYDGSKSLIPFHSSEYFIHFLIEFCELGFASNFRTNLYSFLSCI